MENFVYDIGTKVYFGRHQIEQLPKIVSAYGKRLLLVYGGGSIKRNGIYDAIIEMLQTNKVQCTELSGIEANPKIDLIRKGIRLAKDHDVDMILAVGGGSVIDSAKLIAAGVYYEHDPWDLVKDPQRISKALPIITILTIAATGSEMDHISVISNPDTNEKIGTRHPVLRPKVSILDPAYTYTVSKFQTASGIADILSHAMESYFSNVEGFFQDRMAEAIMKTVLMQGLKVIEEPDNYEARANLMWCSSWAINDFLKLGKMVAWSVHPIEHQLSAVYDITHGAGLAILTPRWLRKMIQKGKYEKIAEWAENVFDVNPQMDTVQKAEQGIVCLEKYYKKLNLPDHLSEFGIDQTHFREMAEKAAQQLNNSYVPLTVEEVIDIYKESL